jgi:membrane-bound ClpP family serine protease
MTMVFFLRSRTWKRLMLKKNIDSKVEVDGIVNEKIKPGDTGETVGRLAPMGKVMVNDVVVEAKSIAGFVDPHTPVEVVKIGTTQIIVKPINKE